MNPRIPRFNPFASHIFRAITTLAVLLASGLQAQLPTKVDLSSKQTPFRDQKARTTCTCFGAIAGLEAAYKRAGYGSLDLSEEFCNYIGKMSYIHPNWNTTNGPKPLLSTKGASYRENQVSAFGGGGGAYQVNNLKTWLRVPLETDMPYLSAGYDLGTHKKAVDPYWAVQHNVNTFNLDKKNLKRKALTARRYYGVSTSTRLLTGNNPTAIEAALNAGFEVVWDFTIRGTTPTGGIWRYVNKPASGGHTMLIVGYDRSDKSSSKHHFICKNSWGNNGAMPSGFTHISYQFVKSNGNGGAFITKIQTPSPWKELAFIGRYNMQFDGHKGTLDIYHIPGSSQSEFNKHKAGQIDRRIGTFRDAKGVMHRVNGIISGDRLNFWWSGASPNLSFGAQREKPVLCRNFFYYMVDPVRGEIAGWHYDNAGTVPTKRYGGSARTPSTILGTSGYLSGTFNHSQAVAPEQWLGRWFCKFDSVWGYLSFQERNDLLISASERVNFAAIKGEFVEAIGGKRTPIVARVLKSRAHQISVAFRHTTRGYVSLTGYMMVHQRGAAAGMAYSNSSYNNGFYAYRLNSLTIPGVANSIGKGCKGSNGTLTQTVSPAPFIGKSSVFRVTGGKPWSTGLWVIGAKPLSYALPGTSCLLRVDPLLTIGVGYGKGGFLNLSVKIVNDRSLIGAPAYSQFGCFDSAANSAGLITSNSMYLFVGGFR